MKFETNCGNQNFNDYDYCEAILTFSPYSNSYHSATYALTLLPVKNKSFFTINVENDLVCPIIYFTFSWSTVDSQIILHNIRDSTRHYNALEHYKNWGKDMDSFAEMFSAIMEKFNVTRTFVFGNFFSNILYKKSLSRVEKTTWNFTQILAKNNVKTYFHSTCQNLKFHTEATCCKCTNMSYVRTILNKYSKVLNSEEAITALTTDVKMAQLYDCKLETDNVFQENINQVCCMYGMEKKQEPPSEDYIVINIDENDSILS